MAVSSIRLQNYRSYDDSIFEFDDGVNIVVGPNASGKTNLLEAVLVASAGKSYRTGDSALVNFDADWARIEATTNDLQTRIVKIKKIQDLTEKIFEIDGNKYSRLGQKTKLPIVVFEPEHISLLTGQPEKRRMFLDTILSLTQQDYGAKLREYKRALAQRNSLLKSSKISTDEMFVWDLRLSELAGHLNKARTTLVDDINQRVVSIYHQITAHKANIKIIYKHSVDANNYSSSMLKQLQSNLKKDIERGFTSTGPHREDFYVEIDQQPTSIGASRGENRSMVLALKIIELELTEEAFGKKPILLLDDVFSELDGGRRQSLAKAMRGYQTFISTTDADVVVEHFMQNYKIIPTT